MPAPPLSEDVLRQTVEALQKYGTETEAAKALGMSRSTFQTRVRVAASRGFAPGHFNNGVTVVQHPTLAARDAYAARGGWIADRAAQAITYHKRFGQVGRVMVCPEMVEH
jgi:hypothetical protein